MNTNERTISYGQNSPATVIAALLALGAMIFAVLGFDRGSPAAGIVALLLLLGAALLPLSLLIAKQWEKAVVLALRQTALAFEGPGCS